MLYNVTKGMCSVRNADAAMCLNPAFRRIIPDLWGEAVIDLCYEHVLALLGSLTRATAQPDEEPRDAHREGSTRIQP